MDILINALMIGFFGSFALHTVTTAVRLPFMILRQLRHAA